MPFDAPPLSSGASALTLTTPPAARVRAEPVVMASDFRTASPLPRVQVGAAGSGPVAPPRQEMMDARPLRAMSSSDARALRTNIAALTESAGYCAAAVSGSLTPPLGAAVGLGVGVAGLVRTSIGFSRMYNPNEPRDARAGENESTLSQCMTCWAEPQMQAAVGCFEMGVAGFTAGWLLQIGAPWLATAGGAVLLTGPMMPIYFCTGSERS